jgi:hypothetical protein
MMRDGRVRVQVDLRRGADVRIFDLPLVAVRIVQEEGDDVVAIDLELAGKCYCVVAQSGILSLFATPEEERAEVMRTLRSGRTVVARDPVLVTCSSCGSSEIGPFCRSCGERLHLPSAHPPACTHAGPARPGDFCGTCGERLGRIGGRLQGLAPRRDTG